MQSNPILLSFFLLFNGCILVPQAHDPSPLFQRSGYEFPYQLSDPDESWALPNILAEISGISFVDENRLACIQDEKGVIFIYHLKTRKIELERTFAKDGDYEGIEILKDDAWILKSNGTLYRVTGYLGTGQPEIMGFPTALTGKNDTEGLAFDPDNGNLLIACKEAPFFNDEKASTLKAVYSFNIASGQLMEKPFLLIDPDSLRHYEKTGAHAGSGDEDPVSADPVVGGEPFMPSGIAVHPLTGDIYILGSTGKMLLVYSNKKEMLAMVRLNRKQFPQPEGICFSPDGKLFISSEGKEQPGRIMRFKPH
jgi:uncharacterized protein YjiK